MSRLNLEDSLWSDSRFLRLVVLLQSELLAAGAVVLAWKLAQKYWCPDKRPIPKFAFLEAALPKELIQVGLAEDLGDAIRIRGAEEHFAWWFEKQSAGRRSAEARRSKYGTAQPPRTPFEQTSNSPEQPRSSSSSSSSSSAFSSEKAPERGKAAAPPAHCVKFTKAEDLLEAIPIFSYEKWVRDYTKIFVDDSAAAAWRYYSAELESQYWPMTTWVRKINAWLSREVQHRKRRGESDPKSKKALDIELQKIYAECEDQDANRNF